MDCFTVKQMTEILQLNFQTVFRIEAVAVLIYLAEFSLVAPKANIAS